MQKFVIEGMKEENILLDEWELPPFDKIKLEDYEPAIRACLAEAERRVEEIATSEERPTFENTVEALETASRRLDRVAAIMTNLNECCTSEALQEVAMRLEPEITRFSMQVMTDRRLYERVIEVESGKRKVECGESAPLDTEQRTLLEETSKGFQRHGVALEGEARERYKRNEEELTELKLRFGQNALADLNAWTLHLTDEHDLEGLPDSVRTAAREEAASRQLDGWVFTLAHPSFGPFMTYSARRDLRERMYRAHGSIGGRGNGHDNNAIIRRIVELRAEQARLLGYDTYCDYVLCDRMVGSLGNLRRFMQQLHDDILPAAKKDLADLQALASDEVMPWDVACLAEQLRRQRYDFDSEQLRPYFPLEAVREGIFGLYGRLYGLRFEEDRSVPVYHEDVRVYRVSDGNREMGLLYLDMHPRASKRSGAWMTSFREQSNIGGKQVRPLIQVVCNFSKPVGDKPALLSFDEVETFMHELGHAMHGMLSDCTYPSISGTSVKRDFVEMPSQVMENWCYEPEFLNTFARHYQTGEPLPGRIHTEDQAPRRNTWPDGYCVRQLNLGLADLAFHTLEATKPGSIEPRIGGQGHDQAAAPREGLLHQHQLHPYLCRRLCQRLLWLQMGRGAGCRHLLQVQAGRHFRQGDRRSLPPRDTLQRAAPSTPAVLFRNFMGRDPNNKALLKE